MVVSPCISICKSDPITGYCYGCSRSKDEISKWKKEDTDDSWKIQNIKDIKNRMASWQLKSFEESYNYKCKNGISIAKKIKMEQNK